VAAKKAPVLGTSKSVTLDDTVFGVDVKQHLVHEAVRAQLNAERAGTRGAKSRGLVSGGRAKPWRQKGTGRARAGTTRAPQFTGGGVAFPPVMRSYDLKVNKKSVKAALRSALTTHAAEGSLYVVDANVFETPRSRQAVELLGDLARPVLVVADPSEENLVKSFRNLDRVAVMSASELGVAELVWARSLLVSETALELVQRRASA
jgi:large subunit ribosomal protein L4